MRVAGKIINTMWIDFNKGDITTANYRSQLVAKEFRVDKAPEYFAVTPPVECLR